MNASSQSTSPTDLSFRCVSCGEAREKALFQIGPEEKDWSVLLSRESPLSAKTGSKTPKGQSSGGAWTQPYWNTGSESSRCRICRGLSLCQICARFLASGIHPPPCSFCQRIARAFHESGLGLLAVTGPTAPHVSQISATVIPPNQPPKAIPKRQLTPDENQQQSDLRVSAEVQSKADRAIRSRSRAQLNSGSTSMDIQSVNPTNHTTFSASGSRSQSTGGESEQDSAMSDAAETGGILNSILYLVGGKVPSPQGSKRKAMHTSNPVRTPRPVKSNSQLSGPQPKRPRLESTAVATGIGHDTKLEDFSTLTPIHPSEDASSNVDPEGAMASESESGTDAPHSVVSTESSHTIKPLPQVEPSLAAHRISQFRPEPSTPDPVLTPRLKNKASLEAGSIPLAFQPSEPLQNPDQRQDTARHKPPAQKAGPSRPSTASPSSSKRSTSQSGFFPRLGLLPFFGSGSKGASAESSEAELKDTTKEPGAEEEDVRSRLIRSVLLKNEALQKLRTDDRGSVKSDHASNSFKGKGKGKAKA